MRDKEYSVRTIRISDEIWAKLKKSHKSSDLSWNLFIKEIINLWMEKENKS